MSGISNRMFSVQMNASSKTSEYEAFKALTTGRNWNRGSVKVVYDDSLGVSALRCVNHSINPFSRTEKFDDQEVIDLNKTFECVIAREVEAIGKMAVANAAANSKFPEGSKELMELQRNIESNVDDLKSAFSKLVKSKIKETTDFWGEHTTKQPLSRKDMGAIILEVEALRKMTEKPEMAEMWNNGFFADDMTSLHGMSDKAIVELMNSNVKIFTEKDEKPVVQEGVKPVVTQTNVKPPPKVSSSAPIEMEGVGEDDLGKARVDAQEFAKLSFGELVRLNASLAKSPKKQSAELVKWFGNFNNAIKERTGFCSAVTTSQDGFTFKDAMGRAQSVCNFVAKKLKSETDKAWIGELNKILASFTDLPKAVDEAKKKLRGFVYYGGTARSRDIVRCGMEDLVSGNGTFKEWAALITHELGKGMKGFTSFEFPDTALHGNRVKALSMMMEKLLAKDRPNEYRDDEFALMSSVRCELEEMIDLARKVDEAELKVDVANTEFMTKYGE